jgi:hypothetical protein
MNSVRNSKWRQEQSIRKSKSKQDIRSIPYESSQQSREQILTIIGLVRVTTPFHSGLITPRYPSPRFHSILYKKNTAPDRITSSSKQSLPSYRKKVQK